MIMIIIVIYFRIYKSVASVGAGIYGASARIEMKTNKSINGGVQVKNCRFSEERINYILSFSPVSFCIIYDEKDKI